jgi:molecular chaperone IbpA
MMNNLTKITTSNLTDWIDRHFVDFDRFFDGYSRATTSYPPHNIVKRGDDATDIEMAVAGFKPEEISVTVEGGRLTITAESASKTEEGSKVYAYRGISTRSFTKAFHLPENWEVREARFEHGLLIVSLLHHLPEEKKAKRIEIKTS